MKIKKEEQLKRYDPETERKIWWSGEVFRKLGSAEGFQFIEFMAGIGKIKLLMEIQEREGWRKIPGITSFDECLERFNICRSKYYETKKLIKALGEELLQKMDSFNIPRYELKKLKDLPDAEIQKLISGEIVDFESINRTDLIDVIHQLVTRHEEEKKRLERERRLDQKAFEDEKAVLEKEIEDLKVANEDMERELNQLTGRKRKKIDKNEVKRKMNECGEALGKALRILNEVEIDWDDKEQVAWYKANLYTLEAAVRNIQARKAEERGAWLGIFDDPDEPI
jgi:hypothetical protein